MNALAKPLCPPVTQYRFTGFQHISLWGTGIWYPTREQYLSDVPF